MDAAELRRALAYSPETGGVTWRIRSAYNINPGDVAGHDKGGGYRAIEYKGRTYQMGRLIWVLVYGEEPPGYIDHRDGDPSNYKLTNLRIATPRQNSFNKGLSRNNSSGVKGVRYCRQRRKWEAWGGAARLGRFTTMEEATVVRSAFEAQHHGEFRRDVSSAKF